MVSIVSSLSLSNGVCHVRSISLPSKSHSSTLQVEDELTHLRSREASLASTAIVETICGSLAWLKKLYTSVNDLISLPQTQEALSHRKDDRLIDELLDRSMRLLDVCGSIKDAMEPVKDHIKNIESALRRGKAEVLKTDASSLLKMKDAKRAILALKQIDDKIGFIALSDLDHHRSSLMSSLRDTSALSFSIFGSLLSSKTIFVWKPKSTIWTMVSSMIHKRKPIREDEPQISNEALESHIEHIDHSLECMSRTLIKTRVSLLNIRSS
ncbi:hypothetical protein SSX86_030541 [Deinandra increscens subsp. villosa]|uniref:Uncharacterized protein n=1 Tax=Deinandra increscens subsp. villosa TaxID=3103831 RepID=A0AAP0GJL0_9ASTR